jgi:hypothetical protein
MQRMRVCARLSSGFHCACCALCCTLCCALEIPLNELRFKPHRTAPQSSMHVLHIMLHALHTVLHALHIMLHALHTVLHALKILLNALHCNALRCTALHCTCVAESLSKVIGSMSSSKNTSSTPPPPPPTSSSSSNRPSSGSSPAMIGVCTFTGWTTCLPCLPRGDGCSS